MSKPIRYRGILHSIGVVDTPWRKGGDTLVRTSRKPSPDARLIYSRLHICKRHETDQEIHGQEPRHVRYDEHESESHDSQAAITCRQGAWSCLVISAIAGHGHRPRGHARHVAGQATRCRPRAQARREGIDAVAQDQGLLLATRAHEGRRDCLFRAENMGLLARHHHVLLPL